MVQSEERRNQKRSWRLRNPDKVKAQKERNYKKHRLEIRKKENDRVKRLHQVLRIKCLTYYGNGILACVCCGESQPIFLNLDHKNGLEGQKRRKGYGLWVYLVTNNFPEGYQTLCWNCNCGREVNGGICPHQVPKV